MIGDRVNHVMTRRPDPYSVRTFCEDCGLVDYVARLVQPFSRPILICRGCRERRTGVPDTRNMRAPIQATASIAAPEPLPAPRIAGLLMPGPACE